MTAWRPQEIRNHGSIVPGTVITTVFNSLGHVPTFVQVASECLDYNTDLRWILVDDGSSDGTIDAVQESIKGTSVQESMVIISVGRLGRAAALNKAISLVGTSYFFNHDFDDISFPNRFAAQARILDSDEKIGCVGAAYVHVDLDRQTEEVRAEGFDVTRYLRHFPLYVPFPHTFMAFRTEAVRRVEGYPTWDHYIEMGLIARLLQGGFGLSHVPDVVGRHFAYRDSFFAAQHGYVRRRYRNMQRQIDMKRQFPFITPSYKDIAVRFLYNFLPSALKRKIRVMAGYVNG